MKQIVYIIIFTIAAILGNLIYGMFTSEPIQVTKNTTMNVMWQNVSSWGDSTVELVSRINPDKFIVNVDGPGSNDTNPHTGPHAKDLIIFIDSLSKHWTGTLVMHTDCSLGDFNSDWNMGGKYNTIPWAAYVDYFLLLNDSLKYHCLPHFTELLIETENSMMSSKETFVRRY